MHPMTRLRNHVWYTRVFFVTVFMSYSRAGLGLYPGQGVNISKKMNSALLHVYTDLQQIIETLTRENQHSILTRTTPFPYQSMTVVTVNGPMTVETVNDRSNGQ